MSPSCTYMAYRSTLRLDRTLAWRVRSLPARVRAASSTDEFKRSEFAGVPAYRTKHELYAEVATTVRPGGLNLEFGVFQGASLRDWARLLAPRGLSITGFDSFDGLPESWGGLRAGSFRTAIPGDLPPNAGLAPGLFQDTLPGFLSDHAGPVALLHMDADLYSSSVYVLTTLSKSGRIASGTQVVFDELVDYPGWSDGGEMRALCEWSRAYGIRYRWTGHVDGGATVSVEVVSTA